MQTYEFGSLLLFWIVFMILTIPSVAAIIEGFFARNDLKVPPIDGIMLSMVSPRVAKIQLSTATKRNVLGLSTELRLSNQAVGEGIIIDDRPIMGKRVGRVAITSFKDGWEKVTDAAPGQVQIFIFTSQNNDRAVGTPVGTVDAGTRISDMIVNVHPDTKLEEGHVLSTELDSNKKAYYQIVGAEIRESSLGDNDVLQIVCSRAGQLGTWDVSKLRFAQVNWVPSAGGIVYRVAEDYPSSTPVPLGQTAVGRVPHSQFIVHVKNEDIVVHNTAIIGVTGSGKSYLAFHLIESLAAQDISVLVLDMSRQHAGFLSNCHPNILNTAADVGPWFASDSKVGIFEFTAGGGTTFPTRTRELVDAAFAAVSTGVTLSPGVNLPTKLCIVFEEAHSLIPEWNQIGQPGDTDSS